MHPFFDASKLSDDEIREKLGELQSRLWAAHAMAMSYDMREQIQGYIAILEQELQMRFATEMQKSWDALFPDVIETEPDLKPDAAAKKAAKEGPKKKEGVRERPANAPQFNKVYKK